MQNTHTNATQMSQHGPVMAFCYLTLCKAGALSALMKIILTQLAQCLEQPLLAAA